MSTATLYPDGAGIRGTGWRGLSGVPEAARITWARICSGYGRHTDNGEHLRVMRRTAGDGFKHKFSRERDIDGGCQQGPIHEGDRPVNGKRDVTLGQRGFDSLLPLQAIKAMDKICKTCRHFRTVPVQDAETGEIGELGYCLATRNFGYRTPECTCKRWNYRPEEAIKQ